MVDQRACVCQCCLPHGTVPGAANSLPAENVSVPPTWEVHEVAPAHWIPSLASLVSDQPLLAHAALLLHLVLALLPHVSASWSAAAHRAAGTMHDAHVS